MAKKRLTTASLFAIVYITVRAMKGHTMQTFFEATPQQKKLAAIGRDMQDYSEDYGKHHGLKDVTDDGLRTLNHMSHVGYLLTHYGAPFGTKESSFNEADRKLIVDFMNKKVDIERK